MNHAHIIQQTEAFVQRELAGDATGHDWWHIHRVRQTALYICEHENADRFTVELAALLHDVGDWKFTDDVKAGAGTARTWLTSINAAPSVVAAVGEIIERLSYKGGFETRPMPTIEGKIVQDADRLDALGPVGIARTFAYGGAKGNPVHIPGQAPQHHTDFEAFKTAQGTTINHFHEKLLKLRDTLHTETGKRIGNHLHHYLETYLADFHAQWEGRFDEIGESHHKTL